MSSSLYKLYQDYHIIMMTVSVWLGGNRQGEYSPVQNRSTPVNSGYYDQHTRGQKTLRLLHLFYERNYVYFLTC